MEIEFNYIQYPLPVTAKTPAAVFGELEKSVAYTFSGKSALALALRHFRSTGQLENKMDQLLVPRWMGSWIYMTMHHDSFPTLSVNDALKGVMVYHQWGFPQKMDAIEKFCKDRGIFLIEDCAHAFSSFYHGQRVGTFGDVSIWSLSKFFSSVVGGAVYSEQKKILEFVKKEQEKNDARLEEEVFEQRHVFDKNPDDRNSIELEKHYAVYPRLSGCPEYSLKVAADEIATGALSKRKVNFEILKKEFWGAQQDVLVEDCDVTPWVVPLFLGSKNRAVANALLKIGVESGVYNFDVNRNMLESDFQECVPIPCHQGISDSQMDSMVDTVRRALQ